MFVRLQVKNCQQPWWEWMRYICDNLVEYRIHVTQLQKLAENRQTDRWIKRQPASQTNSYTDHVCVLILHAEQRAPCACDLHEKWGPERFLCFSTVTWRFLWCMQGPSWRTHLLHTCMFCLLTHPPSPTELIHCFFNSLHMFTSVSSPHPPTPFFCRASSPFAFASLVAYVGASFCPSLAFLLKV